MSTSAQITISAAIGGTAEALGGGKPACRSGNAGRFANGAVTGAFVMAYNHLHDEKVRKELQNRLQKALEQQHSYYHNMDPFDVMVGKPFAIDFTLENFEPNSSILRNMAEDISLIISVDGEKISVAVDVHMRTASNPNNKRYNIGVQILPLNSSASNDGFALPSGYNAAIYNNVETRNYSGSPIVIINFSSEIDYLNFMRYVSE
jgi:hypothetical protein